MEPDLDGNDHLSAICLIGAAAYQTSAKETGCYIGLIIINELNYILKKQEQKPPRVKKQQASRQQIQLLCRLMRPQIAGCHALAEDVVYTLEEDEQDALGNTTVPNARELEELRSALLNWLHNMANVFLKKAVDTLP
jgi:hypothetical protein